MRSFVYVVKDEVGLHARPAGMLVRLVGTLTSEVWIKKGEKKVEGTRILALMGLGVGRGDEITVEIKGGDEAASEASLRRFLSENL